MTCPNAVKEIISQIRGFQTLVKSLDVTFEETSGPKIKQDPDYREQITFEARFCPSTVQSLYLEFWVTLDGQCAVGVGKFGDLAKRVGARCFNEERFIGGNEPKSLTVSDIAWIFEAVRCGKLQGTFRTLPLIGLVSAHICVPQDENKSTPAIFDWIKSRPHFGKCLSFEPWMRMELPSDESPR